jgi:hypothetical protein
MLRLYALLASLHTYIGWRLLPDMPYGAVAVLPTLALLVACALLVPSGFARRRRAAGANDQALVWAGMIALGLFSSLFVLTLARDVVLALAWLADDLLDPAWHRALIAASAIGVPVVALAVTAIGFVNARTRARIRDVEVPIDGLPKALDGFTIAQISDLHVGPTIRRDYVQAVVDAVNRIDADVVAVTGDLVDGSVEELAAHTEPLQRLTSRHGVFFVTGNHEYYSGAQAWIAEVARLGMRVLSNEHVVVDHARARGRRRRDRLRRAPLRPPPAQRSVGRDRRRAGVVGQAAARAPAAVGVRGRACRIRPPAFRPHAWRPVPAVELARALLAAVHRGPAPARAPVGLHEPRHRLLGAAQALRRTVRDHAPAAGRRLTYA